ncbi:MAG: ferritin [Muribaculaceae bacterium]|nr:ferritin [Muribaculaceae bacterium]
MISPKIQDAINAQINAEFWSAYLYLSMGMHFESEGCAGIANWFRVQFKEEQAHAEIFINYLLSRGGKVELKPIAEVPTKWKSPLDAFEATLAHEEKVTAMINSIYALAEAEHDYATRGKLDWFVAEQVEEEETAQGLIDRLKMIGKDGLALYMLDNELAARVYNVPAPLATKE